MSRNRFTPKLFTLLKEGISREQVIRDLMSGIIVGIVALPLAIAFAIASGVSPDKGLVTAIIAGFIISAFGGSRVQIGGPTGAFIVIVYAIVQEHGVGGLTIATFMAGFLIIAMGLARLGNLLKFIPYPLIVGFTSGIAVIIASSQVKDFLGLPVGSLPADFIGKWQLYFNHMTDVNLTALLIAAITVLITFNFHRITSKIPGSLVAIILATLAVQLFHLPVDTIETRFGDLPTNFPGPAIPHIDLEIIRDLMSPAFAIAMLGAIESLLSAVVADGMIGGRHRSNMELVAQGSANIVSSIFGGIPATGAIARTATNIRNGGRTPLAGIMHTITLLLIMIFFGSYAKLIPLSCLAGILMVVSYHMSEWRNFKSLLRSNRMDVIILLTTFFLTVVFDLVIAIEIGIVLSSLFLMQRMSESLVVQNASVEDSGSDTDDPLFEEELPPVPQGVALYEINGPLFFGAAQKFQEVIEDLHGSPRVLILRMRHVPFIDATGAFRLKEIIRHFENKNVQVILSAVNSGVMSELQKSGILDVIPVGNITPSIQHAIERAKLVTSDE